MARVAAADATRAAVRQDLPRPLDTQLPLPGLREPDLSSDTPVTADATRSGVVANMPQPQIPNLRQKPGMSVGQMASGAATMVQNPDAAVQAMRGMPGVVGGVGEVLPASDLDRALELAGPGAAKAAPIAARAAMGHLRDVAKKMLVFLSGKNVNTVEGVAMDLMDMGPDFEDIDEVSEVLFQASRSMEAAGTLDETNKIFLGSIQLELDEVAAGLKVSNSAREMNAEIDEAITLIQENPTFFGKQSQQIITDMLEGLLQPEDVLKMLKGLL